MPDRGFSYLTANTDAAWDPAPYIVRTNDLHHIDVAQRETVTNAVPYYFSKVDGKYYLTAYEDFTTYDENAIIELDSQEDGTLQAAGYVYFQRGHVSASDEVYRSKQS